MSHPKNPAMLVGMQSAIWDTQPSVDVLYHGAVHGEDCICGYGPSPMGASSWPSVCYPIPIASIGASVVLQAASRSSSVPLP